ncbi:39S ribosomal protein L38, mitochondrial [Tyrophagus putrescentiae]|nr:39S ribosomal protein L38, mitochondrial [Tyrophagus putrescentiae]
MKNSAGIDEKLRFSEEDGEDDELLSLELDNKTSSATLTSEEYRKLSCLHSFTKEHLDTSLTMAHHFAIYRDLFYRVPTSLQTNRRLIEANAKNESKFDLRSQPPTFSFLPLVPIDAEFYFDDGKDEVVCQKSYRGKTTAETTIKYLPVYGIRGFGYHRYAFVLFRHNKAITGLEKVDDFDLTKRKFNGYQFMNTFTNQDKDLQMKPVGLSWFQTTWNESCRDVFYNYLDMRSPTYEYIYPSQISEFKQIQFPGRAPFNLYLDHYRDPKEISKEVLLERLKSIHPIESYEPAKMFSGWDGKPKLPHIHPISKEHPDWYKSTLLKKRALLGRWRGLRPASAILPHNNNADLDNPKWPRISPDKLPLNCPNPYPDGKRRPKPLRETLWSKPLPDHHSIRIDFEENLNVGDQTSLNKKASNS